MASPPWNSKIIDSFNNLTDGEIQFFLDELLFKNKTYINFVRKTIDKFTAKS